METGWLETGWMETGWMETGSERGGPGARSAETLLNGATGRISYRDRTGETKELPVSYVFFVDFWRNSTNS